MLLNIRKYRKLFLQKVFHRNAVVFFFNLRIFNNKLGSLLKKIMTLPLFVIIGYNCCSQTTCFFNYKHDGCYSCIKTQQSSTKTSQNFNFSIIMSSCCQRNIIKRCIILWSICKLVWYGLLENR